MSNGSLERETFYFVKKKRDQFRQAGVFSVVFTDGEVEKNPTLHDYNFQNLWVAFGIQPTHLQEVSLGHEKGTFFSSFDGKRDLGQGSFSGLL